MVNFYSVTVYHEDKLSLHLFLNTKALHLCEQPCFMTLNNVTTSDSSPPHTHIHTHIHTHAYRHIHTNIHTHTNKQTHIHTHTHILMETL